MSPCFPDCNTYIPPHLLLLIRTQKEPELATMNAATDLSFATPHLHARLAQLQPEDLDRLDFGVIGFDGETNVCQYNSHESEAAGLGASRVLGQPLFTNVAPCMNNFMVAQRFEDAQDEAAVLDVTVDYVLTLRMRPIKVKLRLLAAPGSPVRYVLVQRKF
jgi:photoactive yellow protein